MPPPPSSYDTKTTRNIFITGVTRSSLREYRRLLESTYVFCSVKAYNSILGSDMVCQIWTIFLLVLFCPHEIFLEMAARSEVK